MAITLDATIGGSSANSYVTVAEFLSYVEAQPFLTENITRPANDDDVLIEKLLIRATSDIDTYHMNFDGMPTSPQTQALEFPRLGLVDKRGYYISSGILPQLLKDAVCEMALYIYKNKLNSHIRDHEDVNSKANINGISFELQETHMLPPIVKEKLMLIGNAWCEDKNFPL